MSSRLRWLGLVALGATGCASHVEVAPTCCSASDAAAAAHDADGGAVKASHERQKRPRGLARNIVVFMGDGMGPEQLATGHYAKPNGLRLDALSGPAYANTDSLDTLRSADPDATPTDSAAGATAIATGHRVLNGALSLSEQGEAYETVLEACKKAGKATALVTTSFFYDASPAAFAVHQAKRDSPDVARQMLGETRPDVVMGATTPLFEDPASGLQAEATAAGYVMVRDASQLSAWDPASAPRLLGLFVTDFLPVAPALELFSMTPALERRADSPDPTLATMTARALERLQDDPDGFFLFAEDELLDEMGHRGPAETEWTNHAYPQQVAALDDALGVALDWVEAHSSFEETLIVVLADHETGGYQFDHAVGPASGRFEAVGQGDGFLVGNHTRTPVAVYAVGPGSAAISKVHSHLDTHRLLLGELR